MNTTWQTTYYKSPYVNPTTDRLTYAQMINSLNFYSTPTTVMQLGYNQYIKTNVIMLDQTIGSMSLSWEQK